jgi:hypothetical protein
MLIDIGLVKFHGCISHYGPFEEPVNCFVASAIITTDCQILTQLRYRVVFYSIDSQVSLIKGLESIGAGSTCGSMTKLVWNLLVPAIQTPVTYG